MKERPADLTWRAAALVLVHPVHASGAILARIGGAFVHLLSTSFARVACNDGA